MDKEAFHYACEKIITKERERLSIGTLGEKTVHAVVKNYLEAEEKFQEVKIDGYYADIYRPVCNHYQRLEGEREMWEIIEIQTRNFSALRKKLTSFLKLCSVTVVYPMPYVKWLRWIDTETGELTNKRKSPKRGQPWDICSELYRIKDFLRDKNLRIHIVRMNMEETRLLNGWSFNKKKGSTRYDRIPLEMIDEFLLNRPDDYKIMIPEVLKQKAREDESFVFTVKDYQAASRLSPKAASAAVAILKEMQVIKMCGKRGKAYLYQITI